MTIVTASSFKARCLALLDEVAEGGGELIVTKHGRPVAKIVPVDDETSLDGSVKLLVGEAELLAPIDEHWKAQ